MRGEGGKREGGRKWLLLLLLLLLLLEVLVAVEVVVDVDSPTAAADAAVVVTDMDATDTVAAATDTDDDDSGDVTTSNEDAATPSSFFNKESILVKFDFLSFPDGETALGVGVKVELTEVKVNGTEAAADDNACETESLDNGNDAAADDDGIDE
jgi:hypothetical protein